MTANRLRPDDRWVTLTGAIHPYCDSSGGFEISAFVGVNATWDRDILWPIHCPTLQHELTMSIDLTKANLSANVLFNIDHTLFLKTSRDTLFARL